MSLALSKTAGGSGGASSENICNLFPHLGLERVSPALKMTQKNNINRNTFILENWQFNNKLAFSPLHTDHASKNSVTA